MPTLRKTLNILPIERYYPYFTNTTSATSLVGIQLLNLCNTCKVTGGNNNMLTLSNLTRMLVFNRSELLGITLRTPNFQNFPGGLTAPP